MTAWRWGRALAEGLLAAVAVVAVAGFVFNLAVPLVKVLVPGSEGWAPRVSDAPPYGYALVLGFGPGVGYALASHMSGQQSAG